MDANNILSNTNEDTIQSSLINTTLNPIISKIRPYLILHYFLLCVILIFLVLIYKQRLQ